jgi:hypothetical protein
MGQPRTSEHAAAHLRSLEEDALVRIVVADASSTRDEGLLGSRTTAGVGSGRVQRRGAARGAGR